MAEPRNVIVLCGEGEHTDPWHDLPATSAALAGILGGTVLGTADPTLRDALPDADLLVVNATSDPGGPPPASATVVDPIVETWQSGTPVLAVHSSALAFRDDPRWRDLLGGCWRPGVTFHPPIGPALVERGTGHPQVVERDFVLYDERYSALELDPDIEVLAWHTEDGIRHPLVWSRRTDPPAGRSLYSALGHGTESYESAQHRELLTRAAEWLTRSR